MTKRTMGWSFACLLSLSACMLYAGEYSWQQPHAKVLPGGDLQWAPQPFAFQAGKTTYYIDFDAGDDANPGTKDQPWKHHPWDPAAEGNAKAASGPATYVFKRGVIYRGKLVCRESGTAEEPIRLTSDPSWGEGPAWITGSFAVTEGWKKADADVAPEHMPNPETVWYQEFEGIDEPWCIWQRDGEDATRIWIARSPNWNISNPDYVMSEWYQVDGPSRFVPKKEGGAPIGSRTNWDEDIKGLPKDFNKTARIWVMWSGGVWSAMGTLYDDEITKYDPEKGKFTRKGMGGAFYFGMGGLGDRYYLERHPLFLDAPGEFYFQPNDGGSGGKLFLRLPDDKDPNTTTIEMAQKKMLLRLYDAKNIEISGLQFSFLNVADDYNFPIYPLDMRLPTAVMLYGDCRNIDIHNNRFYHAAKAVQARTRIHQKWLPDYMTNLGIAEAETPDYMDRISVTDNEILEADHGGISFQDMGDLPKWSMPTHEMGEIKILRNRLHRINFRPRPPSPGLNIPAISVDNGTRVEIAGNIITRSWGVGIWCLGGKSGRDLRDRPLIRNYIHHNKIVDSLLVVNDWGALAAWQGGPQYVYNNHVGNPVAPHPHNEVDPENHKSNYSCNGYAYYLDGSYKHYVFNNIAWGKQNDPDQWYKNRSPQMMVLGFMNQWFNNTFHKFLAGATGSSGTRSSSLGNIYSDISSRYIAQGISGDISTAYGGEDAAETLERGMSTLAYANNLFYGVPPKDKAAYSLGTKGRGAIRCTTRSLEEFRSFLEEKHALASQAGWEVDSIPLEDPTPSGLDFRLKPQMSKDTSGVKYFVPFALTRTVGEWTFSQNHENPELIYGMNMYMSPEYIVRNMYYDIPRNDLHLPGATAKDYVMGDLENWTQSAFQFDGTSRYGVLKHEAITSDYVITVDTFEDEKGYIKTIDLQKSSPEKLIKKKPQWKDSLEKVTGKFPGAKRVTVDMDTNNFVLEVYLAPTPGKTGTVVCKLQGDTGYALNITDGGVAALTLSAAGQTCTATGQVKIADGKWHHLIAEADRSAGKIRLYVDGKMTTENECSLPAEASLQNTGDFFVGKGPAGFYAGTIDFLRVSRGSLAESFTTIEELHAWVTDGPFLHDFVGKKRTFNVPGAIELP